MYRPKRDAYNFTAELPCEEGEEGPPFMTVWEIPTEQSGTIYDMVLTQMQTGFTPGATLNFCLDTGFLTDTANFQDKEGKEKKLSVRVFRKYIYGKTFGDLASILLAKLAEEVFEMEMPTDEEE